MTLLKVKNLKVHYPIHEGLLRRVVGFHAAVDDVSLELKSNEILAIVGESGSGKTTLARSIAGLVKPTSGEIEFIGNPKVQMIFQDPAGALNPRQKIIDAFIEPLLYFNKSASREEANQKAATVMEWLGLEPKMLERYPHAFSLGQKQRLALGRALMIDPTLILCDEPVSALDVSVQAQILTLILKLKRSFKLSFLFITHDLTVVRAIADRVIVMHKGKIVESNDTESLFNDPKEAYTQKLLNAIPAKNYF